MKIGQHRDGGYVEAVEKFNPIELKWEDTGIDQKWNIIRGLVVVSLKVPSRAKKPTSHILKLN